MYIFFNCPHPLVGLMYRETASKEKRVDVKKKNGGREGLYIVSSENTTGCVTHIIFFCNFNSGSGQSH